MHVMHDQLGDGGSVRLSNVMDDYDREGLGIDGDDPHGQAGPWSDTGSTSSGAQCWRAP